MYVHIIWGATGGIAPRFTPILSWWPIDYSITI